jgi:predicted nucleotidyltransferase
MATQSSPGLAPQISPAASPDWLPAIVERLVRRFAPVRIILFGSRAGGQARADSDLDLLLVLPQAPDRRAAAVEVMRELRDLPVGKDIIVTTPEHLAERGQVNGLIYKAAIEQGRVIYERR